jgi:hypothetical protein
LEDFEAPTHLDLALDMKADWQHETPKDFDGNWTDMAAFVKEANLYLSQISRAAGLWQAMPTTVNSTAATEK